MRRRSEWNVVILVGVFGCGERLAALAGFRIGGLAEAGFVGEGAQFALRGLDQNLDLALDLVKLAIERAHQGDAPLKGCDRFLERQLPCIDLADDLLEVGEFFLELFRFCRSRHLQTSRRSVRARSLPRRSRISSSSPTSTAAASEITRPSRGLVITA